MMAVKDTKYDISYIFIFKKENLKLVDLFWRKCLVLVLDTYLEISPPNGYCIKLQIKVPKGPCKTLVL